MFDLHNHQNLVMRLLAVPKFRKKNNLNPKIKGLLFAAEYSHPVWKYSEELFAWGTKGKKHKSSVQTPVLSWDNLKKNKLILRTAAFTWEFSYSNSSDDISERGELFAASMYYPGERTHRCMNLPFSAPCRVCNSLLQQTECLHPASPLLSTCIRAHDQENTHAGM